MDLIRKNISVLNNWVRHLTFFLQLVLIPWMVTLSSCLVWQIISFILPPNGLNNASLSRPAIDLQKMSILLKKKIIFSVEAHFNLDDAHKTSHCLVRILVQKHNWIIFLRKCARRGRYSQWQSLSGHVERIFVHKNWREGYWQHLVSTGLRYVSRSRSCTRCFAPCF